MEYHDAFWLAVAAAAPVIALATIVGMSDAKEHGLRWHFAAEKAGRDSLAARLPVSLGFTSQAFTEGTHAARFNKLLPPLVIGNLILQSLVFAAALLSLARQFNELSPIIIAVAEVVGLALLAAVTAALNYAKYHLTKLEEQAWFLEYYKSKAPSDAPASDGNDIGDADQVEG